MAGREIQGEHGVFAAREGEQFGELFTASIMSILMGIGMKKQYLKMLSFREEI